MVLSIILSLKVWKLTHGLDKQLKEKSFLVEMETLSSSFLILYQKVLLLD
jgi:hypothetical protein